MEWDVFPYSQIKDVTNLEFTRRRVYKTSMSREFDSLDRRK